MSTQFILLQARNTDDQVIEEEALSFSSRLEIDRRNIKTINILYESNIRIN